MSVTYIDPEEICDHPLALVVDVRDSDYDVDGHFVRAVNMPLHELNEPSCQAMIAGAKELICYCMQSRQRGPFFAMKVHEMFPKLNVMVVNGGYINVKRSLPEQCTEEQQ